MCGVAGWYRPNAAEAAEPPITPMLELLRHRGPDEYGLRRSAHVGLGMRRLAVIDPSGSHQPVATEDDTVWAVGNGEIYNYREVRDRLTSRGHRFSTSGDIEVVVHLYEEHGLDFVHHLRGMYAIALWDDRRKRLVLARDRIGIKPLHYALKDGGIVFSSELTSLMAGLESTPGLDPIALSQYLTFGYVLAPRTIYQNVHKLPPGCMLIAEGGRTDVREYWRVPTDEITDLSFPEAAAHLRSLIMDAVDSHMVSDVPLGALLSGGIDSSVIASAAAEQSAEPVRTFSIGFDRAEYDELPYAQAVARHVGTQHTVLTADPHIMHLLPDVVRHHGEPFADSSSLPTWVVSGLARAEVTVALSGDGGDELFGGYTRYLEDRRRSWVDRVPLGLRQVTCGAIARRMGAGAYGVNYLRDLGVSRTQRYMNAISTGVDPDRNGLMSREFLFDVPWQEVVEPFESAFDRVQHREFSDRLMYVDLATYLPDDVLTKVDRMSMAHSLEVRPPLLDHHIVEFAMRLPSRYKIAGGQTKRVLHEALAHRLPKSIRERSKQGFGVPIGPWLRSSLRDRLDLLHDTHHSFDHIVNRTSLEQLAREHLAGRRDHSTALWKLFVLNEWARQDSGSDAPSHAAPLMAAAGAEPHAARES